MEILMITFEKNEKVAKEEVLNFLESKGHLVLSSSSPAVSVLEHGSLVIDPGTRTVKRDDENIELTNYEFEILYLLAKNPGQVFSKEQIYNQVWKTPFYGAQENVMSLIRRIRKKIEPNPAKPIFILTEWGVGYKFNNARTKE